MLPAEAGHFHERTVERSEDEAGLASPKDKLFVLISKSRLE
jgi:hypothetical protein